MSELKLEQIGHPDAASNSLTFDSDGTLATTTGFSSGGLKVKSSGGGTFSINPPSSASDRTLTLPDEAGTVLTSASTLSSSNLSGALPAIDGSALTGISAGKILQVVQTVKTDTFTTTTILPSFADVTGMSATITPSSTSSKVLVICNGGWSVSSPNYAAGVRLVRGGTNIAIGDARGSEARASALTPVPGVGWAHMFNITYLDSPSTTSATTYKLQLGIESAITAIIGGTWSSGAGYNGSFPTILILMEVEG